MTETGSRIRLNLGLSVAALLCVALVAVVALTAKPWEDLSGEASSGDLSGRAGSSVGVGTVTAVRTADEEEQQRVAAQLEAATKMVNAFMNIRYDEAESTIEAVRSMSTGAFLEQYDAGAEGLVKGLKQAESVQEAEVVWAGLVAGDDDSATVILAVEGTVSNKATEGEKQARHFRLQLDLLHEDDRWLANDLQFVSMV